MSAKYEELREGILGVIGTALDEEQDKFMSAIDMMGEKGLKVTLGTTILPTDDPVTNEIKVSMSFVPEKVTVKTEGFTERIKEILKKVK